MEMKRHILPKTFYSEVLVALSGQVNAVSRLSVSASEAGGGGVFQITAGEDDVHRGLKAAHVTHEGANICDYSFTAFSFRTCNC